MRASSPIAWLTSRALPQAGTWHGDNRAIVVVQAPALSPNWARSGAARNLGIYANPEQRQKTEGNRESCHVCISSKERVLASRTSHHVMAKSHTGAKAWVRKTLSRLARLSAAMVAAPMAAPVEAVLEAGVEVD